MRVLRILTRGIAQKRVSNVLSSSADRLKIPEVSLTQYLFEDSHTWINKPLITCGATGKTYSYGETQQRIDSFGYSLVKKLGIKKGQVIGLILPNIPEFVVAAHGALKVGIVVTFISPLYTTDEILRQFVNAGVVCIVADKENEEKAQKIGSKLKDYKGTVLVGSEGEWDLEQLSKPGLKLNEFDNVNVRDLAILPYSSGTTGIPKGVKLTHFNCIANVEQFNNPRFVNFKKTTDDHQEKVLSVLPFFHIYGFNGILSLIARRGLHMISMPKFTPEMYIDCLKKYKPSVLFLVPSLLMFLATHPSITAEHLESVKKVGSGAAPATKTLINLFKTKFSRHDINVQQGYGMTESSPVTLLTPYSIPDTKVGSTGIVVPGTKAKVVCLTTGKALPAYKTGELYVRGPQIMSGYLKNDAATRETIDSEGWLHTGDVAYYDEDGYFYITDRTKELIKVKGNQVSPTELESLILELHGVTDVAVIGIPDERSGEIPKAFVVLTPNVKLTEMEVAKHVEQHVAPYKKLSGGVQFITAIPRNAAGKILRHELKKLHVPSK